MPNSEGLDEWGKLYLHFQFSTLMLKRFTKSVRQKKNLYIHTQTKKFMDTTTMTTTSTVTATKMNFV